MCCLDRGKMCDVMCLFYRFVLCLFLYFIRFRDVVLCVSRIVVMNFYIDPLLIFKCGRDDHIN